MRIEVLLDIHDASVQIRSFFWSVFSRIRTKYGDLQSKPPYSVQITGKYRRERNSVFGHFSRGVYVDRFLNTPLCFRTTENCIFCYI